jgi:hypothetical protein
VDALTCNLETACCSCTYWLLTVPAVGAATRRIHTKALEAFEVHPPPPVVAVTVWEVLGIKLLITPPAPQKPDGKKYMQ